MHFGRDRGCSALMAHGLATALQGDSFMAEDKIRFEDGAGYERMMGRWSQLVGELFLDWLAAPPGGRWVDVGCGNGAFTELLAARCKPMEVQGLDPSEGQLAYARTRPAAGLAQFRQGEAMALPFADDRFDAAVMALVIFFLSDPARGVAEMVRVVRPGGIVAAYAWDIPGGGFPLAALQDQMRAEGMTPLLPPRVDAARIDALHALWTGAGLQSVETCRFTVERTFADFDDLWATSLLSSSAGPAIKSLPDAAVARLKQGLRARLPADHAGRITHSACANAVNGRVPE